jgi:hypothetical protein
MNGSQLQIFIGNHNNGMQFNDIRGKKNFFKQ